MLNTPRTLTCLLYVGVVSLFCHPLSDAHGAPLSWDGSIGDWDDDARWLPSGSEPTAADDATIDDGVVFLTQNGEIADEVYVGNSLNGTLFLQSGGVLSSGVGYIATTNGSSGLTVITDAGSSWTSSGNIYAGNSGNGTLSVQSGGVLTNLDGFIAVNASSTSSADVIGAGSVWNNRGLYVGFDGDGTLDVSSGGAVTSDFGYIARRSGSTGMATVAGSGSNWHSSVRLSVGGNAAGPGGTGQLTTHTGGSIYIGDAAASYAGDSRLVVSDSEDFNQEFTGQLVVNAGSTLTHNGTAELGWLDTEYGTAIVRGPGAVWNNQGRLDVGDSGSGRLTIEDGGEVNSTSARIAVDYNSAGRVTVTGAGSTWNNTGELMVGREGFGELIISDGGSVDVGGDLIMALDPAGNGARMRFDISSLSDPFLDVAGNAQLKGDIWVTVDPTYSLNDGDAFTLIDIGATQTGTFDNYGQDARVGSYDGIDLFLSYTGGDGNDVVAYAVADPTRYWIASSPGLYQDPGNWSGGVVPGSGDPIESSVFVGGAHILWDTVTGDTASGDIYFEGSSSFTGIGGTFNHIVNGDMTVQSGMMLDNMNLTVTGRVWYYTAGQGASARVQGQSVLTADRLLLDYDAGDLEVDGPDAKINIATSTSVGGVGQSMGLWFLNGSVGNTVGDLWVGALSSDTFLGILSGSQVFANNVAFRGSTDDDGFIISDFSISSDSELIQTGASTFELGRGTFGSSGVDMFMAGTLISGTGAITIYSDANAWVSGEWDVNGPMTVDGNLYGWGTIQSSDDVTLNGYAQVNDSATVVIGGDLNAASESLLSFVLTSDSPSPIMLTGVSSVLNIDALAKLDIDMPTPYANFRPSQGDAFVILDSEGTRSGNFDLITTPDIDGIVWQLSYPAKPGGGFHVVATAAVIYVAGDTDGDGDIDDADLGTAFSNFTGPVGAVGAKTFGQGDTDGDGDVDDADLANAFAGFTGPLNAPGNVPEPTSLALLAAGVMGLIRRRRRFV